MMKYHRGNSTTTDRSISIDSHVTVGRTESGQHKHMQAVNKGYLLASNEAHHNDRVATQKRPLKPRVALSSKPREEEGEDYDSDYSEVAITAEAANKSEIQESMGISIHQNVAYELDEDAIATVNSVRQAAAVFGSPIKTGGGVPPPQVKKKPPEKKAKPKRMTSSSLSSTFEASTTYDVPKSSMHRPVCLEDSTADSVYDMVRSEYGGEVEITPAMDIPSSQQRHASNEQPQYSNTNEQPQYSNTGYSVQESVKEQSGGYYNHRDLELMKHAEVLYSNLKEDDDVPDYENMKKESDKGEALYGNLNQDIDAEERDYYNRREMMITSRSNN